jgi:hypothetical protein
MLRTPTATEGERGHQAEAVARARGGQVSLSGQFLPTPVASDAGSNASGGEGGDYLRTVALNLLPTPTAANIDAKATTEEWLDKARDCAERGKDVPTVPLGTAVMVMNDKAGLTALLRDAPVLPTPQVDDAKNTGHNTKRRPTLASTVYGETNWGKFEPVLPTPVARDYKDGQASRIRDGVLQTDSVSLAVFQLPSSSWGKFEPAIRRWETITGNPAPAPTIGDGKDGAHRLSSLFTEWMMGLPAGWITGSGLTRTNELKMAGNGVVPQQAVLALSVLLDTEGK